MTLSITTMPTDAGTIRLALAGEIDLGGAKPLREAIHAAVRDRTVTSVIVDLDGVTFIDSTGIATLVDGRKLADVCLTAFRIDNARDLVRRVLEITGVLTHLSSTGR